MTDTHDRRRISRRTALSAIGGAVVGAAGGVTAATVADRPADSEDADWPYWTEYWTVTRFEANPAGHCDLQVILGLRNDADERRTWTGVINYFNPEYPNARAYAPSVQADPGEEKVVGPWIKAEPGTYEIVIKGTEHEISDVVVADADRGCGAI